MACDQRASADDGSVADLHAGHDGALFTQPCLLADDDRTCIAIARSVQIMTAVVVADGDVSADHGMPAYLDAVRADDGQPDIAASIASERQDGFVKDLHIGAVTDDGAVAQYQTCILTDEEAGVKDKREFTIFIERSFVPRFRLEEFVDKIVVERDGSEKAIIDFYTTKYESQFNRRHRPFLNELKRIIDGDTRSDILDFETLKFVTFKAYGADDLHLFSYCAFNFKEIREYEGEYILSFDAIVNDDGTDLIKEYDDKISEYKFKNNLPRDKKTTIDYFSVLEMLKDADVIEEEKRTLEEFKKTLDKNG